MMAEAMIRVHAQTDRYRTRKKMDVARSRPIPIKNGAASLNLTNSCLDNFLGAENKACANVRSLTNGCIRRGETFVVGQKLRESKWFTHEEMRVFCAVIETGFIVERKDKDGQNEFGIAVWTPTYEKSKDHRFLSIYQVKFYNKKSKIEACNLLEFWEVETQIKICNKADKSETALDEETIRNQIKYAETNKRKWENSEEFVHFCRYGPPYARRLSKIADHFKFKPNFFTKTKSASYK